MKKITFQLVHVVIETHISIYYTSHMHHIPGVLNQVYDDGSLATLKGAYGAVNRL